jgi:hypothetical protein
MADETEDLQSCDACGATVYPEHIANKRADRVEGKLLCVHCLKDKLAAESSIPLAEGVEEEADGAGVLRYDTKPTAIKQFAGADGGTFGQVAAHEWRRELLTGSPNATRCKTFHCKLADGPIAFLNEQINDWADADENIEIKFATTTIGIIEGKHADTHLIITVFY